MADTDTIGQFARQVPAAPGWYDAEYLERQLNDLRSDLVIFSDSIVSSGLTTVQALAVSVVTKAAADSPYAVAATDFLIRCNAAAGNVIVTVPDATGSGRYLIVKKTDSSANTVSLTPAGGSLIDGAASQVVAQQYESIVIIDAETNIWDLI